MRIARWSAAIIILLALGIQLIPIGVTNPPVVQEPEWSDPQVRALAKRACFDCHSNETVVPWYGRIAPVSWYVADHVNEGREHLNLSEMNRPQEDAHEAGEEVLEGEMPPAYYLRLHPEARLTDAERKQLAAGLDATLGGEGHGGDGAGGDGHSEDHDEHEHDEDDD